MRDGEAGWGRAVSRGPARVPLGHDDSRSRAPIPAVEGQELGLVGADRHSRAVVRCFRDARDLQVDNRLLGGEQSDFGVRNSGAPRGDSLAPGDVPARSEHDGAVSGEDRGRDGVRDVVVEDHVVDLLRLERGCPADDRAVGVESAEQKVTTACGIVGKDMLPPSRRSCGRLYRDPLAAVEEPRIGERAASLALAAEHGDAAPAPPRGHGLRRAGSGPSRSIEPNPCLAGPEPGVSDDPARGLASEQDDALSAAIPRQCVPRPRGRGVRRRPLVPVCAVPRPRVAQRGARCVAAPEQDDLSPRAVVGHRMPVPRTRDVDRCLERPVAAVPRPRLARVDE